MLAGLAQGEPWPPIGPLFFAYTTGASEWGSVSNSSVEQENRQRMRKQYTRFFMKFSINYE